MATGLIKLRRRLYAGEDLGSELDETIYALDSMTIDLSLQLFPWAEFRSTKAGVKLHTQLDLRGPIPVHIEVRTARSHGVLWLDTLIFEPGAFYLLECAYMDSTRLAKIVRAGAFFVMHAKANLRFLRFGSNPKVFGSGVSSDQVGHPTLPTSARGLSFAATTHPIRRSRRRPEAGLSHQPSRGAGRKRSRALQKPLADRTLLPLDRTAPAHQTLLRHFAQRGEDPSLDRGDQVCAYCHPAQEAQATRIFAQNSEILSVHPFEKNTSA